MLNSAGYYTLPTQYNVAVALENAQINMDKSSPNYLLQNLDNVYTDPDPRTYPLSSYVYMIEPTGKYPTRDEDHNRQAAGARRLRVLRHLPGSEGDRSHRLLAAAGQPRRGRLRADPEAPGGGPRRRPAEPEHRHLRQPDLRAGQPEHELPGRDRAVPPRLRQGGRRSLRRRRDPERHRSDAGVLRHRTPASASHAGSGAEHDRDDRGGG